MRFQRNLKQIQDDLRRLSGVLKGVDQIAATVCPDVTTPMGKTVQSFDNVDSYHLTLMLVADELKLVLSATPDVPAGHDFPGYTPDGCDPSEAAPPDSLSTEPDPQPEPQSEPAAALEPPANPQPDPAPLPDPPADAAKAKLESVNWFGQRLTKQETKNCLREFFVKTNWDDGVIESMLAWLRGEIPFPLDSVEGGLHWLLYTLERNSSVAQRLIELGDNPYRGVNVKVQYNDDDSERGKTYTSLYVADRSIFVHSDDLQRRDAVGRDWPLVGLSIRLLGLRLLMELPNFDPGSVVLQQLDDILVKLFKGRLTLDEVINCDDWSALSPPPLPRPPRAASSSRQVSSSSDTTSTSASDSSTAAYTQSNEPKGKNVDEIQARFERLFKFLMDLPETKLHMPDPTTFVDACVAMENDGNINEDDIREIAIAVLADNDVQEA